MEHHDGVGRASLRRPMAAFAAALLMAIAGGCGAPRDPALEKRAFAAAQAHEEAIAAAQAARASEGAKQEAPTERTWSPTEMAAILGAVPGEGAALWAEIRTERGTIRCRLAAEAAPQTVTNFVALARGAVEWRAQRDTAPRKRPLYDGLTFHRAIAGFIIQAGNPTSTPADGPGWTIPRETGGNAAFEQAGAMAMIEAGDRAHGSQFFVTVRPALELAKGYGAFGTCEPAALLRQISDEEKLPAAGTEKSPDQPKSPVKIFSVKVTRGE